MKVDTSILGLSPERAKEMPFIASMGIYVAKASVLQDLLGNKMPEANDFGSEIIPGAAERGYKIQAFLYDGYWEDIGTVAAFYKANLSLVDQDKPQFSFYDKNFPIYTMSRFLPPSKINGATISNCNIGDGCQINPGTYLSHCMVGLRSVIGEDCRIEDSLLMGCDYYEKPIECELLPGCLPIGIGEGCTIKKAIVDKNARIGPGSSLVNKENIQESFQHEESGIVIKDGIIIVLKDGIVPSGFQL